MEEDHHHLLQPLIPSTTTNAATTGISSASSADSPASPLGARNINKMHLSNSGIIFRLAFIISIGLVSIWANHEASKGYSISIINKARGTFPGKRFDLFYVSNDEASRLVLSTSKFVENFLYPNSSYPKKQVNQVILRLSSRNLISPVTVDSGQGHDQYVLHISPSVVEEKNFSHAMFVAVQQGMVRIWLWDDLGNVPSTLIDGIVEYISNLAVSDGLLDFGYKMDFESPEFDGHCWNSKNPKAVAQFLNYCEVKKPGFIRRLNQALKNGWHDRTVDDALGMPVQHLCIAHNSSSFK